MKKYKRIADIRDATFDSLENLCNNEALDGWRVINITNGDTYRTATLEKDYDITVKQDSERSGLQATSATPATGNGTIKARARNNSQST